MCTSLRYLTDGEKNKHVLDNFIRVFSFMRMPPLISDFEIAGFSKLGTAFEKLVEANHERTVICMKNLDGGENTGRVMSPRDEENNVPRTNCGRCLPGTSQETCASDMPSACAICPFA